MSFLSKEKDREIGAILIQNILTRKNPYGSEYVFRPERKVENIMEASKMDITKENEKIGSVIGKNDNRIFYGETNDVTAVGTLDYNDFSKQSKRAQNWSGFDTKYRDFVDYIIQITHNIWEEKGIGVIYDTYHNNVVMHLGTLNITGIKEVVSGTMQTLHAFPDRRLIGQNVIWSDHEKGGFLSSHRVVSTATNLGDSNFGPATGRKLSFRTVIDCAAKDNRIYEEWLVRDNLWIVQQLGFDAQALAKKMAIATAAKQPALQSTYGMCEAMDGQLFPTMHIAKDDSVGEIVMEMVSRIYNYKFFNEVKKYYHSNAVVHFVCDKDLMGYDEIQGMLISLFASVPNASYDIERVTCNRRVKDGEWDVAVRWRIRGLNEGIGYFGAPSGKPIDILGISHYHMSENKVIEEWVTFDGLDVLRQKYKGCTEE